jgi:hypothetical protein
MPILDSKQRSRLTPAERNRVGELVSDLVREVISPSGHAELRRLMEKAGPKADPFDMPSEFTD